MREYTNDPLTSGIKHWGLSGYLNVLPRIKFGLTGQVCSPQSATISYRRPLAVIVTDDITKLQINKNERKMKKLNLISILIFILSMNLVAQTNDSLKSHLAQVTFAYPVGSNGTSSPKYSNDFSFNVLYGLNGGVNGLEIGSILNYNKGKVNGFQLSGVSNINTGYSKGFLLSGVSNICLDSTTGLFISGVLNYSKLNANGFQLAAVNISANEFNGFQL